MVTKKKKREKDKDVYKWHIVCYQEIDLPIQFPSELRKYIPNMYWNTIIDPMSYPMRVVALVTLGDVEPGEELFSTYMDLVHS